MPASLFAAWAGMPDATPANTSAPAAGVIAEAGIAAGLGRTDPGAATAGLPTAAAPSSCQPAGNRGNPPLSPSVTEKREQLQSGNGGNCDNRENQAYPGTPDADDASVW